jgi:hypothetical protein
VTQPLNASPTKNIADMICQEVWRNMTLDEWIKFVGVAIPYERTCPNLPVRGRREARQGRRRCRGGDAPRAGTAARSGGPGLRGRGGTADGFRDEQLSCGCAVGAPDTTRRRWTDVRKGPPPHRSANRVGLGTPQAGRQRPLLTAPKPLLLPDDRLVPEQFALTMSGARQVSGRNRQTKAIVTSSCSARSAIDFAWPLSIRLRHRCERTSALTSVSSRRGFGVGVAAPDA